VKKLIPLVLATVLSTGAFAQEWPTKPVRVVVPAPAGSSLDIIVRAMGEKLKDRWKQPLVVENKPGAGGMLGMEQVAKAAPDGYTLGIGFNGPVAFGPFMYKTMPYNPQKDLVPVVLTTSQPNVLAVPANHPAKTLQEYVAWAKAQPKGVSYASVGAGSSSHLTMELFRTIASFQAVHVPFNGSPPAGLSVASGDTPGLFTVAPALLPLIDGGRVRLLAVTSSKRLDEMKNLPTVAEAGYPGFEALAWNGLFTAPGTPTAVIDRINADVNAALQDPGVRENLIKQGLLIGGGTPASFRSFIDSETRKWGDIIKRVGLVLE
jgi:tripartite-type tricarboxylate transporter receptor subunit TctC